MATATAVKLPGVAEEDTGKKKKKLRISRKKMIIVMVILLLLGATGYVLRPGGDDHAEAPPQGPVLKLESVTLNLDDGHFLKLGLALQFTAEAADHGGSEPDGAQALDLAIDQLSNRAITDLNSTAARNLAKDRLTRAIEKAYHGAVTDVYFTEFVMQ